MFARDYNLLNEIYSQRIYKEDVGMGPNAISDVGPTPIVKTKITLPPKKACAPCEEDDIILADMPNSESDETNAYMAKQQLYRIAKMAYMLHDLICDREELEPWFASKITQAHEQLDSVFGYKDYEQYREEIDSDEEIEEGTDRDLINSINSGGDTIISQIKKAIRNESKETVEKVLLEVINTLELKK